MSRITKKSQWFFQKIKSLISLPYRQRLFLKHTIKRPELTEGNYAIINMDQQFREDDYSRYLYILCIHLERAGFKPVVKMRLRDFKLEGHGFRKFIWKETYVFVRQCFTPENTIVLKQPGKADHVMQISYGYNVLAGRKFDCIANYPMEPHHYMNNSTPLIDEQRKTSRRAFKIFFSGKTSKQLYANVRVKTFFNVMSRLEVIQFVLTRFADRTKLLQTAADAERFRQLIDSNDTPGDIVISEVKTDKNDWLKTLAKSDFFICPPGARMPWCHNCIEAMAVGTIPILEYGNLLQPALENMKNCITYSNLEELEQAVNAALNMQPVEVQQLRKNVLDYYDTYLSAEHVRNCIISFSNSSQLEVEVAIPYIPTWNEAVAIPVRER